MENLKIIQYPLSAAQYISDKTAKNKIIFHHTASNGDAKSVIQGWERDNIGRVATAYVISYDGTVYQAFNDDYYAYALGLSTTKSRDIEKSAVQIEICAWGFLRKTNDGKYLNYLDKEVPANEVIDLGSPWRGQRYFHKYSDAQIKSLVALVSQICKKHGIKGSLSLSDFNVSQQALDNRGKGFYTHCSYRADKTDIYPDQRLIKAFSKGWSEHSS